MPVATHISLSAVRAYQRCQQLYAYRYVHKLRKRTRAVALDTGIILHEYLDWYYRQLGEGVSGKEAHFRAQSEVSVKWVNELRRLASAAYMVGEEEVAKDIEGLAPKVARITSRYFEVHGLQDAERYEVLFVEKKLDSALTSKITTHGYCDLTTRDRETGRVSIWEHKSTKNVPPAATRLRDLQTLLYAEQLARYYETPVDSVIWNYIRTKEPTKPDLLKSKVPALTKRKDIDSTWEVYEDAAREHGVELDSSYDEVRARLERREETVFFPRWEQVVVADSTVMLRDYVRTGLEIRRFRERLGKGVQPVRSLDQACDFCEFNALCQAAITGGDEEEVISMKYEAQLKNERKKSNDA